MMRREMLARRQDPHTSHDAAAKVDTFKASHDAAIYAALSLPQAITGMTYKEIAAYAKMEPVAAGRRLKGMERRKLITRRRNEVTGKYLERDGCALWWKA